jgi:hypothetical protein
MKLSETLDRLNGTPGANIDRGFGQGYAAVLKQLQLRFEGDRTAMVDDQIAQMQQAIKAIVTRASPYNIPKDYIEFLESYGGLVVDGPDYSFSVFGVGPMVEEWYGNANSADWALMNTGALGWLTLGSLVFTNSHRHAFQRVGFYFDLAGKVSKNSVIAIGPWDGASSSELSLLANPFSFPTLFRVVADSFTNWLALATETRGQFTY